jgi:hypothetical protein
VGEKICSKIRVCVEVELVYSSHNLVRRDFLKFSELAAVYFMKKVEFVSSFSGISFRKLFKLKFWEAIISILWVFAVIFRELRFSVEWTFKGSYSPSNFQRLLKLFTNDFVRKLVT